MHIHSDLTALSDLVSQRYAVEVLDALAQRPRTSAELATFAPQSSVLDRTLRELAARGIIRTDGTWDDTRTLPGTITLTAAGFALIGALSRFDVWAALYAHAGPARYRRGSIRRRDSGH
ncbi:hypothetical protein [Nocardia mexicana]|uniref:DNA-binding HxlR family transcriptional regulator n=1 Tax=Nocardia mexicana TaxID=279262 RepID=A0A370GZG9_9NOCA|nr:hypothetical protein [Nocardia mexicana]RDI49055.1 DNA-binding HxlR family transcriptional regulator [Nocardia mexicana]